MTFEGLTGTTDKALAGNFPCTIVSAKYQASKAGNMHFALMYTIERQMVDGVAEETEHKGKNLFVYHNFSDMGKKWLLPLLASLGHEYTESGGIIHMPFTELIEEHEIESLDQLGEVLAPRMEGMVVGVQLYVNKKDASQGIGQKYFPFDEDDLLDFE